MLEQIGARRLLLIAALGVAVLVGTVAATNLQSDAVYYMTPTEVYAKTVRTGQTIRLGGLVEVGSLTSQPAGRPGQNEFEFIITDGNAKVRVLAQGAIPGLLREGAGAVVEGSFAADATFIATQVIAKHDEVYTAPTAGATPAHRTAP
ncbi:MAG TPA: cytochrome c maturation protein CcmE [Methylomirabilota bacterium]|nr:cytochrome c maturation protein CcmE [Methylomirabilota bacterium]